MAVDRDDRRAISTVTTSIDGKAVASFTTSSVKPGVPIYGGAAPGSSRWPRPQCSAGLDISEGGTTLFANALDEASASNTSTAPMSPLRTRCHRRRRGQALPGRCGAAISDRSPDRLRLHRRTGLHPRILAALGQLPTGRRGDGHERQSHRTARSVSRDHAGLLGLVLDGRGQRRRHLLPVHRGPRFRSSDNGR